MCGNRISDNTWHRKGDTLSFGIQPHVSEHFHRNLSNVAEFRDKLRWKYCIVMIHCVLPCGFLANKTELCGHMLAILLKQRRRQEETSTSTRITNILIEMGPCTNTSCLHPTDLRVPSYHKRKDIKFVLLLSICKTR